MADESDTDLLGLTADIVAAHVGHNRVGVGELPELIARVHEALAGLGGTSTASEPELKPAVSVRASIKPDHIVCLEDGKKLTMLKRYLRTNYDMTPQEYRAKWKLPADYPMVAPDYADKRRTLAKAIGLGRQRGAAAPASKRGRPAAKK